MYKQNRKAAHERYLQSYQARKDLKKRMRQLEFEHFPTEQSHLDLDPDQLHNFNQIRISYINAAKDGHPDLDFGNLDPTYDDITEPQLQFDPEHDEIPMS